MQQFFLTVVFQNFQTRKLNSSALTEFIFEKDNFLNFLGVLRVKQITGSAALAFSGGGLRFCVRNHLRYWVRTVRKNKTISPVCGCGMVNMKSHCQSHDNINLIT